MKIFRYIVFIPVLLLMFPITGTIINFIESLIPFLSKLQMDAVEETFMNNPSRFYFGTFTYSLFKYYLISSASLYASRAVYPDELNDFMKLLLIFIHLTLVLTLLFWNYSDIMQLVKQIPDFMTKIELLKLRILYIGSLVGAVFAYVAFYREV